MPLFFSQNFEDVFNEHGKPRYFCHRKPIKKIDLQACLQTIAGRYSGMIRRLNTNDTVLTNEVAYVYFISLEFTALESPHL